MVPPESPVPAAVHRCGSRESGRKFKNRFLINGAPSSLADPNPGNIWGCGRGLQKHNFKNLLILYRIKRFLILDPHTLQMRF